MLPSPLSKRALFVRFQRHVVQVMESEIARLVGKHSCVRQGRAVGLFGCLDIVNEDGDYIQEVQGASYFRPEPSHSL